MVHLRMPPGTATREGYGRGLNNQPVAVGTTLSQDRSARRLGRLMLKRSTSKGRQPPFAFACPTNAGFGRNVSSAAPIDS
jgi:hypothetical protein